MAWLYSHCMSGFWSSGLSLLAYLSHHSWLAYMGQRMSVFLPPPACSKCTGLLVSWLLIQSYAASKLGPLTVSLPNDHMMTLGWLKLTLTLCWLRCRICRANCGFFASESFLYPKPCDSWLASAQR